MSHRFDDQIKKVESILSSDELFTIERQLNREPNAFELHMFAVMWSEHISYKSSAQWINELPVTGSGVRIPARAENAGVIDLDDTYASVIKLESHNHPTAVNPMEAAVAVGNIFRDIISMGAYPVAHLNILRFGDLTNVSVRTSLKKVVSALGSYSNNFGVPVVGGEVLFDKSYTQNPLLNVMAIGLVKKERIITASFKNKGDMLLLIGRETSGTGVHGAGFASMPLSSETQHLIPETQVADPVSGKILADCIMELNEAKLIRSMQDIGAGGVLCAAAEMANRGNKGVRLDINKIPVLREDLEPVEKLISQSQEQMLFSASTRDYHQIKKITDKWDIRIAVIGEVLGKEMIEVYSGKEKLANLPVSVLVRGGGAPIFLRNMVDPKREAPRIDAEDMPFPDNLKEVARLIISNQNVASRKYIYEQFDTMAGLSNVSSFFPSDAGILSIPGSTKLIALSVDGNPRYVKAEPRKGTIIAVAEAARNIICSGGTPMAIANGLNFGDPSDVSVYYDFAECIKGIKTAAERIGIPVIAGNVSFNNLTSEEGRIVSVQSSPVIGMVGLVNNQEDLISISFKDKGDMIYILGEASNDLSGSEYLADHHDIEVSAAPEFDLDYEIKLQKILAALIKGRYILSAHDVSIGGLFVSLVESCLLNNLGFDITSPAEVREDAFLFGESQSRIVVSVHHSMETSFLDFMISHEFPFSALGHVTKQELRVDDNSFGFITDYALEFENALGKVLENDEPVDTV